MQKWTWHINKIDSQAVIIEKDNKFKAKQSRKCTVNVQTLKQNGKPLTQSLPQEGIDDINKIAREIAYNNIFR